MSIYSKEGKRKYIKKHLVELQGQQSGFVMDIEFLDSRYVPYTGDLNKCSQKLRRERRPSKMHVGAMQKAGKRVKRVK